MLEDFTPLAIGAAALLLLKTIAEVALDTCNARHVRAANDIPEFFRGLIDEETYEKSRQYTLAKLNLSRAETLYGAVILAVVLFSGLLPWLWGSVSGAVGGGLWAQAATFLIVVVLLGLADLPFELYGQFGLEEKFGFNKSTKALWLRDKLVGLVLTFAIGMPLIAVVIWLFQSYPDNWWWAAALLLIVFQLLMLVLYPMLIIPLFNKLSPLPEGTLRDRLMALGDRTGFRAKTIQVIDGSKRSGHSNAFFTGFGKFRRIVLYDTLIEQLEPEELEAVLAHEIGHYKCGHIPRMLAVNSLMMVGAFWLLGYLATEPAFLVAFGFTAEASVGVVLLLFSMLAGLVTFWFGPLMHIMSRKHEYEADAFAREAMSGPESLLASLRKLHEKNLSNLTPHPLYSFVYYSHPTMEERRRGLLGEK